ncbi:unnamed protein product, partial [Prorocentrum cordatum]
APAGWSWVLAEDAGGLAYGSVAQVGSIGGTLLAARAGRRATVTLVGGASAMAFLREDWRRGDFIDKWRGTDARTLARAPGTRLARSWLAVTEAAVEVADPSFPLQPRSAAWCVAWLLREGGPIQHHESWKSRERLSSSDWGVSAHRALSTVLEDLATHDEVNVTNLLGVERMLRKMQLIEHIWDEKQREQDSGQLELPVEEVSAFMGGTGLSSRPSSMACPALLDVVGKELERISQIKKNARKLREEAKAAAGPKASGAKAVEALNGLGGAGAQGGSPPRAGATPAQQQCLARIAGSVAQLGPPPGDLQPLAALQELQAALSYDGSLSTRAEAMGVSWLSLPPPGNHPVALERLLGAEVFDPAHRDISCKVWPKAEVLQQKQRVGFEKPYSDPSLRDPRRYAALARRLHEARAVDLVSDAALVVDEVGLFSVAKKSGRQRLVVDARPATFWFGDPEGVLLATVALAVIELPDGASLWTASADIADAFYNAELPDAWRPYVALPPLDSWRLGRETAPRQPHPQRLWPRLAVLPIGWPRALAICQRVSEAAADRAGLSVLSRIADRRTGPCLGAGAHLVYVDNFAPLALDGDTADRLKDDMVTELRSEGLPLHEEGPAPLRAQVLGWVIDGARGAVTPSPRRAWRIILAARALLAMPKVSAQQAPAAGCSAAHRFIAKAGEAPRPWWPRARRELVWAMGVVPLAHADLRARWLGRVLCADASEWGRGVCEREMSGDVVERMGRIQERWRFRDPSAGAPREQLIEPLEPLEAHVYSEPSSRGHVSSAPSDIQEPIAPVVKGSPHVEPRETDFEPLEWAALVVVGGVTAALRWIPSDANPADLPPRQALMIGARLRWDAVASLAAAREAGKAGDGVGASRDDGPAPAGGGGLPPGGGLAARLAPGEMQPPVEAGGGGRQACGGDRGAGAQGSPPGHVLRTISVSAVPTAKYARLWADLAAWMTSVTVVLRAETADDLLEHWMGQQRAKGLPKAQVYNVVISVDLPSYSSLPDAPSWLEEAAEGVKLATLTPRLCQLRRSSPSVELARQLRALASAELRGRRQADASVARLPKLGRVSAQLQRLAPK